MKKIIIVGLSLLSVIALFVFVVFVATRGNPAPKEIVREKPTESSPTPIQVVQQGVKLEQNHIGNEYSVGIPETMSSSVLNNTSGGKTLIMTMKNDTSAKISIQETDANISSLENQKNIFATLGFTGSPIIVKGIQAAQYSGGIPMGNGTMYEKVIVLQKGTIVYQILLNYISTNKNPELEGVFDQVVSSLSFD